MKQYRRQPTAAESVPMTPLVGALDFSSKLAFYTILSIQENTEYVRIKCLSYLNEVSFIPASSRN